MAPRVGFEPTTNRLTAGCSTTELPRNTCETPKRFAALPIKFGARGKVPVCADGARRIHRPPTNLAEPLTKTRAPFGALEGVGYGGVSPREDEVNIALTRK